MEKKPAIFFKTKTLLFSLLVCLDLALLTRNPYDDGQVLAGEVKPSQSTCVTIRRGTYGTVADTKIIDGSQSGGNYGDYDYFAIGYYSSNRYHSLVKFGLEAIPAGSIVDSATMSLFNWGPTNGLTINVHRVTEDWDEMTVTWDNFNNAYDLGVETSFYWEGTGSYDLDLASLVQEWVNGTYSNYGVLLESPDAVPPEMYRSIRSSEASTTGRRPKLEVCYTPLPCPSCPLSLNLAREIREDGRLNVQLRWNDVNYEDSYRIYRCEGLGCSPSYLTTIDSSPPLPSPLIYIDTNGGSGFEPGTTLRYEVRSCLSVCSPPCPNCPDEQITLPSCDCDPWWQDLGCNDPNCESGERRWVQSCTWSDGWGLCDTNYQCEPDDRCNLPWFKTSREGDVHAEGIINSPIPQEDVYFSAEGAGGSPGMVSYHGLTADFGSGSVSPTGWLAKTSLDKKPFLYFYILLDQPTTDNFDDLDNISADGVYYSEDNVDINNNFPAGRKAIVLVNGDINIRQNIDVPVGSSLVMVASGDIDIDNSVSQVQGLFVADGELDTGSGDVAFEGQGVFIAKSVSLGRDFRANNPDDTRNASQPTEQFFYRPDLVLNTLPDLWFAKYTWREQAP